MNQDNPIEQAEKLMEEFSSRTGLTSNRDTIRYLWTDSFAVCNFLGLARKTGKKEHQKRAIELIEQIHKTLGRHRKDDHRTGWLSGLDETRGLEHPTKGGLRIGKKLPERGIGEHYDDFLEWERDGQYFHYLTKWMHALDQAARTTHQLQYSRWSIELLQTARNAFVYRHPSGQIAMYWKMSIDLSRPLVSSMGQHDPLDGYVTTQQLQATARALLNNGSAQRHKNTQNFPELPENLDLSEPLEVFSSMVETGEWKTSDPLGIGGILMDAVRLVQLIDRGHSANTTLLFKLLRDAQKGLRYWTMMETLSQPAQGRLAFRELGLAIGLQGVQWMNDKPNILFKRRRLSNSDFSHYDFAEFRHSIGEQIISFWMNPKNREKSTWQEHEVINSVMLATALLPDDFLILPEIK